MFQIKILRFSLNIDENFKKLLESIYSEDIDIIDKLKYIIAFIRPKVKMILI